MHKKWTCCHQETHILNNLYSNQFCNVINLPNFSKNTYTGHKPLPVKAALLTLSWGKAI